MGKHTQTIRRLLPIMIGVLRITQLTELVMQYSVLSKKAVPRWHVRQQNDIIYVIFITLLPTLNIFHILFLVYPLLILKKQIPAGFLKYFKVKS